MFKSKPLCRSSASLPQGTASSKSVQVRMTLAGLLAIASLAFASTARCEPPTSEKTLISNGIHAASFAEIAASVYTNDPDGNHRQAVGASVGWQALRGYGQAITVGYGVSGLDSSTALTYGPEFSLALMNNLPVTLVGTYSPLSGYFKRKAPP
jgi:hypothetical protein